MTVQVATARTALRERALPAAWWIAPTVPLLAAALAFVWYLHGELQRLYGLTGSAWDLASIRASRAPTSSVFISS
jgi:hypothetical protein